MSSKALALSKQLAESLRARQTALTVTESFDTDGFALVKLGTGSIGAPGALFKVRPQDWPLAKDVLGLTANIFSPTVVQVVLEANPAGGAGADINTLAQVFVIVAEAVARGTRVELYTSANGNAPDPTDIVAANLRLTWDPQIQYGMIANQ